ncbi:tryptophan 7-halogenase [Ramlibacter sp.]|uniref:tryptophan 7-halogenase n=1 Tax=Ramlibacter sp. TaxID=1917967 RepID=UPI0017B0A20F|nr:tryptophan 7-halogenase [Ramlibacter sp.]MBA2675022.1 tryptophan 7-halogenase [Ramlibacter sp.]
MTHHPAKEYDVIVVGGGPAGATVSTFIAMRGHKVLLLERSTVPRYQIGESLLPATINGICVLLGVHEELQAAGFEKKFGGAFRWGRDPEPWFFNFRGVEGSDRPANAYQVERSKFDHILLMNARKKGVEVRTECSAHEAIEENGRVVGLSFTDEKGAFASARARFVVDASGNAGKFSALVGQRVYSEFFKNFALFGYYENGKRLPEPRSGHILSAAFDEGWFWYIPLSKTLTSVGAVFQAPPDSRKPIEGNLEEAMAAFIARCPIISDFLKDAKRVTEGTYGQLRVRKDWSYACDKFWRNGLALIGDSACFVDPLLSQGVHLATYSGLLAARSINSCLDGVTEESDAFAEFEARYRREYGLFYQYLTSLYDMNSDQQSFFWRARSLLNTPERGNDAFVRLLAGEAPGDPAVSSAQRFFDARLGAGDQLEGMMNPTYAARSPRAGDAAAAPHAVQDFAGMQALIPQLDSEGKRIQIAARSGGQSPQERPIRDNGLVTTPDGLGWMKHTEPAPQPADQAAAVL